MSRDKQRKFYRLLINSLNALNAYNAKTPMPNCSNLWFQFALPGIMDDPFKKFQWTIEQFYMLAVNSSTSVTNNWVVSIDSLPQFDSYSTMTQYVQCCNVMCRGGSMLVKNILFNSLGCPFNNNCLLESGRMNVCDGRMDVLGNEHTDWNSNANYVMMICTWEIPSLNLLH